MYVVFVCVGVLSSCRGVVWCSVCDGVVWLLLFVFLVCSTLVGVCVLVFVCVWLFLCWCRCCSLVCV